MLYTVRYVCCQYYYINVICSFCVCSRPDKTVCVSRLETYKKLVILFLEEVANVFSGQKRSITSTRRSRNELHGRSSIDPNINEPLRPYAPLCNATVVGWKFYSAAAVRCERIQVRRVDICHELHYTIG